MKGKNFGKKRGVTRKRIFQLLQSLWFVVQMEARRKEATTASQDVGFGKGHVSVQEERTSEMAKADMQELFTRFGLLVFITGLWTCKTSHPTYAGITILKCGWCFVRSLEVSRIECGDERHMCMRATATMYCLVEIGLLFKNMTTAATCFSVHLKILKTFKLTLRVSSVAGTCVAVESIVLMLEALDSGADATLYNERKQKTCEHFQKASGNATDDEHSIFIFYSRKERCAVSLFVCHVAGLSNYDSRGTELQREPLLKF